MCLADAERHEPLFADFRREGFSWLGANPAAVTQRTGPSGKPKPPFRKLDWILVRGVSPEGPRIIEALDPQGKPVSDHEMLALDLSLERHGTELRPSRSEKMASGEEPKVKQGVLLDTVR